MADIGPVLVTGASGFIATHIVSQLQSAGFMVRGTVRSLNNEIKVKPLRNLCPNATYNLQLVEADLMRPDSWRGAIQGCRYVVHVASPFPPSAPSYDGDVTRPAVEGTLSVLRACLQCHVKRVVLTSSIHAILGERTEPHDVNKIYTEEDWSNEKLLKDAYAKSKTMAEKAAWEFVSKIPPGSAKFDLVVLNPGFAMGPALCGGEATSFLIVKKFMERSMSFVPMINFAIADVRDIALAHVRALTLPGVVGKRHIICSGNIWLQEIALILNQEFREQGYNIPTANCPYPLLWLHSIFDKTLQLVLPLYNKIHIVDNSKMQSVLGIVPTPMTQSTIDMAYSLIERGFIKKSLKYRGPRPPTTTSTAENRAPQQF